MFSQSTWNINVLIYWIWPVRLCRVYIHHVSQSRVSSLVGMKWSPFSFALSDTHSSLSSANWKRRWAVLMSLPWTWPPLLANRPLLCQTWLIGTCVVVIHWRWKPSFLYRIPLDCSLSHPHSGSLTLHADFKNRTLPQKPRDSKILPVNWSTSHLLFHALYLIILDSHWLMAWHNNVMADGIITDHLKDCTLDVSFWWA